MSRRIRRLRLKKRGLVEMMVSIDADLLRAADPIIAAGMTLSEVVTRALEDLLITGELPDDIGQDSVDEALAEQAAHARHGKARGVPTKRHRFRSNQQDKGV
jgi:antitoxin component of RelBE/YafQ-DinJ toxin-antitoxin module